MRGGVEGKVGYFRRNHLVPIPQVQDLQELNRHLVRRCRQDEQRRIAGKSSSVGEAMRIEREHLLPLATEGFELAETSFPTVGAKGCVKVRTNWYSTPLKPGTRCQARLLPTYVEIWQERSAWGARAQLRPLPAGSGPGALPGCAGQAARGAGGIATAGSSGENVVVGQRVLIGYGKGFQQRYGRQAGTREMIELLRQGKQHDSSNVPSTRGRDATETRQGMDHLAPATSNIPGLTYRGRERVWAIARRWLLKTVCAALWNGIGRLLLRPPFTRSRAGSGSLVPCTGLKRCRCFTAMACPAAGLPLRCVPLRIAAQKLWPFKFGTGVGGFIQKKRRREFDLAPP